MLVPYQGYHARVSKRYRPRPITHVPDNFHIDWEVANLLPTCWQQVVVMEFGRRHDTTDTTDFCPHQLVTDLLRASRQRMLLLFTHTISFTCLYRFHSIAFFLIYILFLGQL